MKTYIKKHKKLFRVVLALCLCCIITMSSGMMRASAATEINNSLDAMDGVVLVASESAYSLSCGTGFAIGKTGEPVRFIVTNYHVVENAVEEGGSVTVYFSAAANNYMVAEVYWCSANKDLAVLRLPEATQMRSALVLCPMNEVDMQDTFYALGYPSIAQEGNDYIKFDKDDIVRTQGIISKTARVDGQDVYMIDVAISSGNSGGPLVNSKGQVVGINTFRYSNSQDNANYALAIDELINSINRATIPYTLSTEVSTGLSTLALILIIAGAVLAIAVVVILVIVLRKKPAGQPKEVKKAKTAVEMECVLVGIGGTMDKKEIPVPASGVTIGRDGRRCTLAYPAEEPGISGFHCTVTPAAEGVYVKDEESSYGTFYDNRKLQPLTEQLVKNNERFYLAEAQNTFVVKLREK